MLVTSKEMTDRVATLKNAIEALADEVRSSDTSKNDSGIAHVTIADGRLKPEGESRGPWPGLEQACVLSLKAAEEVRQLQGGDHAALYWRIEPELEYDDTRGLYGLYMRLSFAPI